MAAFHTTLFKHKLALLEKLGQPLDKDSDILDFGCGKGESVLAIEELGFNNVRGYEIRERLVDMSEKDEKAKFSFNVPGNYILPYPDNSFDLIISDQVMEHVVDQAIAFKEIYRVLKPGASAIHIIPSKYDPIEPHIKVPFGGIVQSHYWFKLWAALGIRNPAQKGTSASEVALENTLYCASGLRYFGNSTYLALWKNIGFDARFVTKEFLQSSASKRNQMLGKWTAYFPPLIWLIHTMHVRIAWQTKSTQTSATNQA